MKYKFPLFFLLGMLVVAFVSNSCKKSNQDYIQTLFTGGYWQLSSVQVTHFVGDTTKSTIYLDTACNLLQTFTFNADNTCTFNNFSCDSQKSTGHWSLSTDKLFLHSDITAIDSTNATSAPFKTAKILNLGQYSLVLQTGDLQTYYLPTTIRTQVRYGFVRVKKK